MHRQVLMKEHKEGDRPEVQEPQNPQGAHLLL